MTECPDCGHLHRQVHPNITQCRVCVARHLAREMRRRGIPSRKEAA